MNMKRWGWLAIGCLAVQGVGHADTTGKLGLNYSVGPSFVVGGSRANDTSRVGPVVGAGAEYGLTRNVAATFNYDDHDVGFQTQTLTFGATLRPMLDNTNTFSPLLHAGIGFGERYADDGFDHFALTLSGGLEHYLAPNLSLAGLLSWFYVPGSSDHGDLGDVHLIEPTLRLTYYFGVK